MAESLQRKLAVILHADVVGSTDLVQRDETLAHQRMVDTFRRFSSVIVAYGGIVQEIRGDALVAEFSRASDAVSAAIVFQTRIDEHNQSLGDELIPRVRVGLAMGEVVIADHTITGAGVILAQRVEQLAAPGGVCIQGAAFETLPGRLPFQYHSLGERNLKGFAEPVRVYAVTRKAGAPLPDADPVVFAGAPVEKSTAKWLSYLAATVPVLIACVFAIWFIWAPEPDSIVATAPRFTGPTLAVLPFHNLSPTSEQEYFSDGITDDIINDLSKFSNLTVIARSTVFTYKDKILSVKTVGEQLGVDYVLEGSVQHAEGRVRINTQLADTKSQRQLWAARYDEPTSNLFELQDKIAQQIVRTLSVRVSDIEKQRVFSRPEANFSAYDLHLRARSLLNRQSRTENYEARELFRQSIELDPSYASSYAGLGQTHLHAVLYGWTDSPQADLRKADELARRSIALDEIGVDGHRLLAEVYLQRRQHDLAVLELQRTIEINPNDADSYARLGMTFVYANRLDAAIRSLELALRIDPNLSADMLMHLGMALYLRGQYADALTQLERAVASNDSNVFIRIVLAATYAQLGREADSLRAAAAVRRLAPFFKADEFGKLFAEPKSASHIIDGLHKAGLD